MVGGGELRAFSLHSALSILAGEFSRVSKKFNPAQPPDIQGAVSLHQKGKLAEAEQAYRAILRAAPGNFDACHLLGVVFLQKGDAAGAAKQIRAAIKINPSLAAAHNNLGNALRLLKKPEEALASYTQAVALNGTFAEAHFSRGLALADLQRFDEAVAAFEQAIAVKADYADAYWQKGISLRALSRFDDALACYDRAIAARPDHVYAFIAKANLLRGQHRAKEALDILDKAIFLNPDVAGAYLSKGNALNDLQRFEEAVACYDKAIALSPDAAEAWNNRSNILQGMNRKDEAVQGYERAISLRPGYVEAYNNLGNVYLDLKRFDKAEVCYGKAMALNPAYPFLAGMHIFVKQFLCDWGDFAASTQAVLSGLRQGKPSAMPFALLTVPATAEDQLNCSKIYVSTKVPVQKPVWQGERYGHKKIRVAYLSSDFHEHATAHLMAGLFENHDRSGFAFTALSFGRDDASEIRKRMEASFDDFVDVSGKSDADIAEIVRGREIDIAVDLKGFTQDCRFGIFARRVAPVQVNYLGYPGTLGASYIDYVIADKLVIPEVWRRNFSEKVVYLPDCYQPNDNKRVIAPETPSRESLGLPDDGFVFCSFNNTYKITPDVFDVWMRLLSAVDRSVLWLLEPQEAAIRNLRSEAKKRGVDPERIVFAPRMKSAQHLARHRQADLFLDTLPVNAHTTASDALWAGLPLLTCMGQTFASRVAGSLLTAAGLPELVTHTLTDYENLALKLAKETSRLPSLRARLADNRDKCALFDTRGYARHLEAAYRGMWERYEGGLSPEHFEVQKG